MTKYSYAAYLDKVLVNRRSIIFFCNNKSNEEIMKWQKSVIKKPLTNIPDEYSALICQMFKNLLGYLGEIKSSKQSLPHIKKLLKFAHTAKQEVKDEVFLHCWKQLSGHTEVTYDKQIKAWKAFAIISSIITPSTQLFFALLNQLLFEIKKNEDENLERHANFVFARLHRIYSRPRKYLPTSNEIQHIEKLKSIPLTVNLFSGEEVIVPIESYTTMRELKELVMRKMGFNLGKVLHYGIYEIRSKFNSVEEAFIEEDEVVCDLLSIWDKELEQALKSRENIEFKLFLKEKIYYQTNDEEVMNFRYHQIVYDYLMGRYKIESDKVIGFASLKLAIEFPDSSNSTDAYNALNEKFENYIPENEMTYDKDEWSQKIMELYINFTNKEGAKNLFIERLQNNEFFFAHQYLVRFSEKNEDLNSEIDFPEEVLLVLKPDSLDLYDEDKNLLVSYKYNKISNWGISSIYFVIIVPKEDGLFVKYYFETPHTKNIQNIIQTYVNLLCGKSINEVDSIIKKSEKDFETFASYRDQA